MSLKFIQILILWQKFSKMFRAAEGIQIDKYRISLYTTRILNTKMVRICKHGHDLFLYNIFFIRQIDAVSERFTHLSLSVNSRKT